MGLARWQVAAPPPSLRTRAGLQRRRGPAASLRACSAVKVQMEMPTWQLLGGGIGRPRPFRFIYSVDQRPFEEVMEAVGSNRLDPEARDVLLVVERPI